MWNLSKQIKKYERAAAALIDAAFTTDQQSCDKYGITTRTLRNYRTMLAEDAAFSAFFQKKKDSFDAAWVDELPKTLKKSIVLIAECTDAIRADARMKKNPAVLAAIAGAMKLCAEVYMTSRIIDARIADNNRPEAELPEQVLPASAVQSQYAN